MIYLAYSAAAGIASLILTVVYLNIRNYRISKREYELRKLQEKWMNESMTKTHAILQDIRFRYDEVVFRTILAKVAYLEGLVSKMPMKDKVRFHGRIYRMTYETRARLETDYYNIPVLIAPLNNLRNEIEKALG